MESIHPVSFVELAIPVPYCRFKSEDNISQYLESRTMKLKGTRSVVGGGEATQYGHRAQPVVGSTSHAYDTLLEPLQSVDKFASSIGLQGYSDQCFNHKYIKTPSFTG